MNSSIVLLIVMGSVGIPSADELRDAIVRSRMKVESGFVRFRVEIRGTSLGEVKDRNYDVEAVFDREKLRYNGEWTRPDGGPVGRSCVVVTSDQKTQYRTGRNAPPGYDAYAAQLSGEVKDSDYGEFFIHPRILGVGVVDFDLTRQDTVDEWMRDSRYEGEVTAETMDGREVWRLTLKPEKRFWGVKEYWVDPSEDYAIRKGLSRFKAGDVVVEVATECRWKEWPGGVWFPTECRLIRKEDSKVVLEEKTTVLEADFSRRPGAEEFTLAAMKIPPGTEVVSPGRQLVWDGSALVQGGGAEHFWAAEAQAWWGFLRRPVFWVGLVSASLAVLLAVRMVLNRRHAA